MNKWNYKAPTGQIYLCPACGRKNKNRLWMGDTSCVMRATLVHENPNENGTYQAVNNPYVNMDKYPVERLNRMSEVELLAAQRDVLFLNEQELFDKGLPVFLKPGDSREDFLDYTDQLINRFKVIK